MSASKVKPYGRTVKGSICWRARFALREAWRWMDHAAVALRCGSR